MTTQATGGFAALTEKEKQTLRLMVRGHDAKSIARSLDLSVHTINERLRDARRKLAVSSSREAARLLFESEGEGRVPHPDLLGDATFGDDAARRGDEFDTAPTAGARWPTRRSSILGVLVMIALALALAAAPQLASSPSAPPAAAAVTDPEVVSTAEQWLTLLDAGRWRDSYQATGTAFQKLNTLAVWTNVSLKVRAPLGAALSRTLIGQEDLPAPPYGYQVVKFRTRFATRPEAVETVTLEREAGKWRIVGVTVS